MVWLGGLEPGRQRPLLLEDTLTTQASIRGFDFHLFDDRIREAGTFVDTLEEWIHLPTPIRHWKHDGVPKYIIRLLPSLGSFNETDVRYFLF